MKKLQEAQELATKFDSEADGIDRMILGTLKSYDRDIAESKSLNITLTLTR
jgi:hypothetical protein